MHMGVPMLDIVKKPSEIRARRPACKVDMYRAVTTACPSLDFIAMEQALEVLNDHIKISLVVWSNVSGLSAQWTQLPKHWRATWLRVLS